MPTPRQLARINSALIYPPLLARYVLVLDECQKRGAVYFPTRGFASWLEQHGIYLQGRDPAHPGPIVTNADAGESDHNYGIGIDSTHDSDANAADGLQPDWKPANYQILGEELKKGGLDWGAPYHDLPHCGWPAYITGAQLAPLREIWERTEGDDDAKLRAVWAHLDALAPALPPYPVASSPAA